MNLNWGGGVWETHPAGLYADKPLPLEIYSVALIYICFPVEHQESNFAPHLKETLNAALIGFQTVTMYIQYTMYTHA